MTVTRFAFWLAISASASALVFAFGLWAVTGESHWPEVRNMFTLICAMCLGFDYGKEKCK